MSRLLVLALAAIVVSACATYQPPTEFAGDREAIADRPFNAVWEDLVEWFANNNIPIRNLDKASGLIATEYRLGASGQYIHCGTLGTYDQLQRADLNVNVLVRPAEAGGTRVRANVFGTATIANQMIAPAIRNVDCTSTGSLERSILRTAGAM